MKIRRFAIAALLALLNSCLVLSIHPFVEAEDAVFDEELLGVWEHRDEKERLSQWRFEKSSSTEYRVTYHEERKGEKTACRLLGRLTSIEGQWYLDLFPEKEELEKIAQSSFSAFFLLPCHSLARLERERNTLRMSFMSPKYFEGKVKDVQFTIREEENGKMKAAVLTSGTFELRAFVAKHASDENLFTRGDHLYVKKKEEAR